jgi:hypothetical protein
MYVHGLNQPVEQVGNENITWLDFLILSNPQGVMKVLAGYGYTGYLAPQGPEEMYEVCLDLMDKKGDEGVIALVKSSTLYDLIADISKEETKITVPFKNATGEESVVITTIKTINYKKLIENALLLIGAFYLAGKLWDLVTKTE